MHEALGGGPHAEGLLEANVPGTRCCQGLRSQARHAGARAREARPRCCALRGAAGVRRPPMGDSPPSPRVVVTVMGRKNFPGNAEACGPSRSMAQAGVPATSTPRPDGYRGPGMTVPASLFLNMFSSDALLLGLQDCVQVISWPGKRGDLFLSSL